MALAFLSVLSISGLAIAATRVDLGTADSFAILAGSTVTNTGPSVINGDLGLSPGTSVTGFPPGTLNGTQHVANANALQAQNDLVTAYNNAAGQTPVTTVPTELGGTTKTAGTYDSAAGTFGVTGTLTLDGAGDPNAVFIFKTASTLITASGSNIVLANGAQACNIFWQVGSSATLGTNSTFKGNILALTSATLTTGANVEGRVLARNGAVTLDTNTVTAVTCATSDISVNSISGMKFKDRNGNGKKNSNDSGLPNWRIYLDANDNAVFDSGELTTVTGADGRYLFSDLPDGTYHVREVLKSGWIQTFPAKGKHQLTLSGGDKLNKNFGNFKLGVIHGMTYMDENCNSQRDSGEQGLSGWVISLGKVGGEEIITTTTDANGRYKFTNLEAGEYYITQKLKSGWDQTAQPSNVRIISGKVSKGNNFGVDVSR